MMKKEQRLANLGGWGAALSGWGAAAVAILVWGVRKASAQKPCGFIGDDGVRCSVAPQTNAQYCEKHMPRDEKE